MDDPQSRDENMLMKSCTAERSKVCHKMLRVENMSTFSFDEVAVFRGGVALLTFRAPSGQALHTNCAVLLRELGQRKMLSRTRTAHVWAITRNRTI